MKDVEGQKHLRRSTLQYRKKYSSGDAPTTSLNTLPNKENCALSFKSGSKCIMKVSPLTEDHLLGSHNWLFSGIGHFLWKSLTQISRLLPLAWFLKTWLSGKHWDNENYFILTELNKEGNICFLDYYNYVFILFLNTSLLEPMETNWHLFIIKQWRKSLTSNQIWFLWSVDSFADKILIPLLIPSDT